MMIKKAAFSSLLILAVSMSGCTTEEKPAAPAVLSPGGQAAAPERAREPAGTRQVKIVPETPTAADTIQAMYTGGMQAVYRWERNNQVLEGETSAFLRQGSFSKGDTVSVSVTSDGVEVTASTVIANSLPRVVSVPLGPQYIHRGVGITASPIATDADGDLVRFICKWAVNEQEVMENSPTLPGDKFRRGDKVMLNVIPYDNEGNGDAFALLPFTIGDAPPRFTSIPVSEFKSALYVYYAAAEDPDGDALTYSLTLAPRGMTIDPSTGKITWPIIGKDDAGNHTIEVVARDPEGLKAIQKYSLAVTVPEEVKDETK